MPLSLLPLLLFVAACAGGSEDPRERAVAHVGETPVSLDELQFYFELNLLADAGEIVAGGERVDRVKSRLLDSLIDEKTLLLEAERRGLEVAEREIDAYLRSPVDAEPAEEEPLTSRRRRALAGQRLMIRKLEASEAATLPAVSEEEVRSYLDAHRERLAHGRRLRVRALRLDSMETARKVDTDIRKGRTNFAQAVVTYETGPGQGIPLELDRDNLPEEFRPALDGLKPGEVSPPLEFHGDVYLFQLDARLAGPEAEDAGLIRRARDELDQARRRTANEALFRRLRERTPVRIHTENLPFRYLAEEEP